MCKCDKDGNWPNEECIWAFKIVNATSKHCTPGTYVMVNECKICLCDKNGKIDKIYCTENCPASRQGSRKDKRRSSQTLDSVYGSCEPKNWYSLAPCQFCYCVDVNKLVCNTGNRQHNTMLELGSYNLTICGKDFMTEAIDLVPGGKNTLLRQGSVKINRLVKPSPPQPPPKSYQFQPVTPKAKTTPKSTHQVNRDSSEKIENDKDKAEYYSDSEEKKEAVISKGISREGLSTQQPYEEVDDRNSNESNELDGEEDRKEDGSLHDDNEEEGKKEIRSPGQEMLRQLLGREQTNVGKDQNTKVLKLNLPSVLDKIFKMALRKSMVKLDTETNCEPGTTKKVNCNVCFCLTNGKLLCTDKSCK